MNNVALLFTSQNNYRCWNEIIFKKSQCDFSGIDIYNIDVSSTEEEKILGKELCKKYNITWIDIDLDTQPMQYCIQGCINYFDKHNIKKDWIIWMQHDSYFADPDFFKKFKHVINNDLYKMYAGLIGTNEHGSGKLGRCNLLRDSFDSPYKGWYQQLSKEYYNAPHFVVESCMWTTVAINVDLWKKHIIPDPNFSLFYSYDDVSHQFMTKNIFTIVIPSLITRHEVIKFHGTSSNRDIRYFPEFTKRDLPEDIWMNKWRWTWGYRKASARDEFIKNAQYTNSLQEKLYNLSIADGPKLINDFL